jgi:hypothetical protein
MFININIHIASEIPEFPLNVAAFSLTVNDAGIAARSCVGLVYKYKQVFEIYWKR